MEWTGDELLMDSGEEVKKKLQKFERANYKEGPVLRRTSSRSNMGKQRLICLIDACEYGSRLGTFLKVSSRRFYPDGAFAMAAKEHHTMHDNE